MIKSKYQIQTIMVDNVSQFLTQKTRLERSVGVFNLNYRLD